MFHLCEATRVDEAKNTTAVCHERRRSRFARREGAATRDRAREHVTPVRGDVDAAAPAPTTAAPAPAAEPAESRQRVRVHTDDDRAFWSGVFGVDVAALVAACAGSDDALAVSAALSRPGTSAGSRRGARRREELVTLAMREAGRIGLAALSFPALASIARCSKSSLVMHFHSKEGLSLAIVEGAERDFFAHVVLPIPSTTRGLARLTAFAQLWVGDTANGADGSLLTALVHEVDGAPGPLRDRVAAFLTRVRRLVAVAVADAHARDVLAAGVTGADVSFRLEAIVLALNVGVQLGDATVARASAQTNLRWLWCELARAA
jgi:AcrR family transcriptional regulator